ncbi:MAG TPA: T9SS type A sorting domain-containing protein [Candidatus Udaeobacter sp.]|nr:T9SS type A sorting domain-containing protein [Candidatus Udaeobacter sp.]
MSRSLFSSALVVLWTVASAQSSSASWTHDPSTNLAVSTAANYQTRPTITVDGQGGTIIAWFDNRSGSDDIYVQRISGKGQPLWTPNGVAVCTVTGSQSYPYVVPDGAGGAIIAWTDLRGANQDIYAQRVNAAGVPQWTANGVPVCTATGDQGELALSSDGAGGAIAAWLDLRSASTGDIYVQRMNGAGAMQWTANGVALTASAAQKDVPQLIPDGTGGAFVCWEDGVNVNAQRVNGSGVAQWTAGGVLLGGGSFGPRVISDGQSGAIFGWLDQGPATSEYGPWTAHLNASGTALWTTQMSQLFNFSPQKGTDVIDIAPDGKGGVIAAWSDSRNGNNNRDIFARRVGAAGNNMWAANGVAVCTAANNQEGWIRIVADSLGGAVMVWNDPRVDGTTIDVFGQRLDANGVGQWFTPSGLQISSAVNSQSFPTLVNDGRGGVVIAWQDFRNGANNDVYAQRVDNFGFFGDPAPEIAYVQDLPADQGGHVRIKWNASYRDSSPTYNIGAYGIWRQVTGSVAALAVAHGARVSTAGAEADRGVYREVVEATQTTWWEGVGTVLARGQPWYTFVAETFQDSTGAANPLMTFMIDAHDASVAADFWSSFADSGYSVDNLAPGAPAPFTGAYVAGATRLHWGENTEHDLAGYRLYRGNSAGFVPSPANLVVAQADTGYSDAGPAGSYYKLSAIDIHGNESTFSLLTPAATSGVGGTGSPQILALAAPRPNPARSRTLVSFDLPVAEPVRLAVYDMEGRRERTLAEGETGAGEYQVPFDLRDSEGRPIRSGLYFVRLEAGGKTLTRRLAIVE